MSSRMRCWPLPLLALAAACDDPSDRRPPPPVAETASSAVAVASAAPSAQATEAAAAPPPQGSVDPAAISSAAPAAESSAKAGAAHESKKGEIEIPTTKNGIVGPGVADRIIKLGSKPIVRLVSSGDEPRTAMSYSFAKGPARPLAVALDTTLALSAEGRTMPPTPVPRITMTLGIETAEIHPAGDFRIDAKLTDIAVQAKAPEEEPIAKAMRDQLATIRGLQMGYWVTPRGQVHDAKVDLPPGFPAQAQQVMAGMNQSIEQMVAPFPGEPIGVGAKWQVVSRIASSGADLLQFATFTLKAREGSRAAMDVTIQQLAANDKMQVPGLAGVSAKLLKFASSGSGTSDVDTKDPGPESGKVSMNTSMEMEVGQGTVQQSMAVETRLTVSYSRPK